MFQAIAADAGPETAIQPVEEAVMSEEVIKKVRVMALWSCFSFVT